MILEYHRPTSVAAAMELLKRKQPATFPLAGGTTLLLRKDRDFAVVDIQDLSLDHISRDGQSILIGAGVTLQQLVDADVLPEVIRNAAKQEASFNLRQAATAGGTVAGASGKSILLSVLLAYNADVQFADAEQELPLGEILPLRQEQLKNRLISAIRISTKIQVTFEKISKTPADQPMLIVAAGSWSGGRTRVVVGENKSVPRLAMDGTSSTGADVAARNLLTEGDAYLREMAGLLAKRCLEVLSTGGGNEH